VWARWLPTGVVHRAGLLLLIQLMGWYTPLAIAPMALFLLIRLGGMVARMLMQSNLAYLGLGLGTGEQAAELACGRVGAGDGNRGGDDGNVGRAQRGLSVIRRSLKYSGTFFRHLPPSFEDQRSGRFW